MVGKDDFFGCDLKMGSWATLFFGGWEDFGMDSYLGLMM